MLIDNNIQHIGAIEDDFMLIILRVKEHGYVLNADIYKIYRQMKVQEKQRKFQRIFWRKDSKHKLEACELNTIIYRTASASYLVTPCINN